MPLHNFLVLEDSELELTCLFADIYIPSQLILISHDTVAQYWEAFGHISFYKRVDIDAFVDVD